MPLTRKIDPEIAKKAQEEYEKKEREEKREREEFQFLYRLTDYLGTLVATFGNENNTPENQATHRKLNSMYRANNDKHFDYMLMITESGHFSEEEQKRMRWGEYAFMSDHCHVLYYDGLEKEYDFFGGIENIFQMLNICYKHGITKAAYYLAKCYETGLSGYRASSKALGTFDPDNISNDCEPYVLNPNSSEMIKYHLLAIEGGYYESAFSLGLYYLWQNNQNKAISYLRMASRAGISDASIMLEIASEYIC